LAGFVGFGLGLSLLLLSVMLSLALRPAPFFLMAAHVDGSFGVHLEVWPRDEPSRFDSPVTGHGLVGKI